MEVKSKQNSVSKPASNFKWKGSREFIHHLFKLKVANFKRKTGYNTYDPKLVDTEHCHFFHSVDRRGVQQTHCTATGGHFHEITIGIDETGTPVAKCGPPLRKETYKVRGKDKTVVEPCFHGVKEQGDEGQIVDNHTHECEYLSTEMVRESNDRNTQPNLQ